MAVVILVVYRSSCRAGAWTSEVIVTMMSSIWAIIHIRTMVTYIAVMMTEVTAIPTI